jgi:uncharacterized protein YndB with AHSA1/START domain
MIMSFTTAFTVAATPAEVYAAVTNVRCWWSEEIEGGTASVGDEFDYHMRDLHRCRIRITEAVPSHRVEWLVLDNHFGFTEDKTEWIGTTVTFEIAETGDGTEVRFTHHGLVSEYECYDICVNAWGFYIRTSLPELIATGTGRPNSNGTHQVPEEAVLS